MLRHLVQLLLLPLALLLPSGLGAEVPACGHLPSGEGMVALLVKDLKGVAAACKFMCRRQLLNLLEMSFPVSATRLSHMHGS